MSGEPGALTLPDHSDRWVPSVMCRQVLEYHIPIIRSALSDLCIWNEDLDSMCIATLNHNGSVIMWNLKLDQCKK